MWRRPEGAGRLIDQTGRPVARPLRRSADGTVTSNHKLTLLNIVALLKFCSVASSVKMFGKLLIDECDKILIYIMTVRVHSSPDQTAFTNTRLTFLMSNSDPKVFIPFIR